MDNIERVNFWDLVKGQYKLKLRLHINKFIIIAGFFLVSFIMTFNSLSWIDHHRGIIISEVGGGFSGIFLVMLFIVGMQLTSKRTQAESNTFCQNKRINHYANILLLVTISFFASVPAFLGVYFIRFFKMIGFNQTDILLHVDRITIFGLISGFIVTLLYLLIAAGLGYLIGELWQLSIVLIIVAAVFLYVYSAYNMISLEKTLFARMFTEEANIAVFIVKAAILLLVLFTFAILIGSKKEVRR